MWNSIGAGLPSAAQLETFRSQIKKRREAVFLAPQLLEQVAVLTRQVSAARHLLEQVRGAAADLAHAHASALLAADPCPACQDAAVRTALTRLRSLLGEESASPTAPAR